MSTSRPPDVIHVIGVPRPSPFFALFCFCVLYWTKSEEQKTGEAWERGYHQTLSLLVTVGDSWGLGTRLVRIIMEHAPNPFLLHKFLHRVKKKCSKAWNKGQPVANDFQGYICSKCYWLVGEVTQNLNCIIIFSLLKSYGNRTGREVLGLTTHQSLWRCIS